jgi:hypothetical protein
MNSETKQRRLVRIVFRAEIVMERAFPSISPRFHPLGPALFPYGFVAGLSQLRPGFETYNRIASVIVSFLPAS